MKFRYTGEMINRSRKWEGISQSQLAKKLQTTPQFVSAWERGLCEPPKHLRKKLIKTLKIMDCEIESSLKSDINFLLKEKMKTWGIK